MTNTGMNTYMTAGVIDVLNNLGCSRIIFMDL